jgi:hypothetical protein
MLDNPFLGLDSATLATLKTKTLDAIQAVLLNQSYSLNGKSVSRADLAQLNNMLGNLQDAINDANGSSTDTTFVSFNGN